MVALHTTTPSSVLAIYAHPDDGDVACGGSLARWAKEGASVHLLVVCDGGRGTSEASLAPADLAARRRGELEAACAVTGASFEVLGLGDGEVENSTELRAQLVRALRQRRPEVVLSHDPTATFFGEHYFNHRDHRMLGWAVLDAVAPAAAMPHYFPEAGPPHAVSEVLLSGTLEPSCFVDISSHLDAKVAAVACHRSQFDDDGQWIAEVLRQRAEDDGRRVGGGVAEGFRLLRPNG